MNNREHRNGDMRRRLSVVERTYIPEIVRGLWTTLRHMFTNRGFTMQYPEQRWTPDASFRGRPVLVQNPDGNERCVACNLCARVCPSLAIEVQADETATQAKERYPLRFEINMLRCIFCGFCEEVCPEEAIVMSKDYELIFTTYEDAIFGKDKLLVPAGKLADRLEYLKKYR